VPKARLGEADSRYSMWDLRRCCYLSERYQRRVGNGNSFVVTLTRVNADTRKTESVRLEPHPPYLLPSAVEARHWGATYALYRVSELRLRS
jgi:hypothetical protein